MARLRRSTPAAIRQEFDSAFLTAGATGGLAVFDQILERDAEAWG
jgi:hypothetical protein